MRRVLAAALLLASGVAAWAAEPVQRTVTFAFGGRDEALRDDVSRRLLVWWDEITSPDRAPPATWDEAKFGPWSLVARTAGKAIVEERPGLAHVTLSVGSDLLPSRTAAADAFAAVILREMSERVRVRDNVLRAPTDETEQHAKLLEVDQRLQREELAEIEKRHGGSPARRAAFVAERLAETERDAARTRVDRAVTARQLETARAAAGRALEIEKLSRDLDALERAASAANDVAARDAAAAKLAQARRRIGELTQTTPALATAREEVFRLEIALIGLETRAVVLDEEIAALRDAAAKTQGDAVRHEARARAVAAIESELLDLQARRRANARFLAERGTVFEVIRAPGTPGRPEEEKR